MSRQPRKLSRSSIYHVMVRGNERRSIFKDQEDRMRFIDTLQIKFKASGAKLFAYCLMDNHVHLLISEGKEDVAKIMKRINVSYAMYFNKKYKRIGHLFQDRFKSEVIEDESHLLEAVRYIHNNPVKAGIAKKASDYQWSSYNLYNADSEAIIDKETVLNMFSENVEKSVLLFEKFSVKDSDMEFIEYDERDAEERQLEKEEEAKEIISDFLRSKNIADYSYIMKKGIRDELITVLRNKCGLSIRSIAKVLEVNRGVVQKTAKRMMKDDKNNRPQ